MIFVVSLSDGGEGGRCCGCLALCLQSLGLFGIVTCKHTFSKIADVAACMTRLMNIILFLVLKPSVSGVGDDVGGDGGTCGLGFSAPFWLVWWCRPLLEELGGPAPLRLARLPLSASGSEKTSLRGALWRPAVASVCSVGASPFHLPLAFPATSLSATAERLQ